MSTWWRCRLLWPEGKEWFMSEAQAVDERRRPVDFTIDGKPYTVDDPAQTAAALLRLAGFDPANYDPARVRQGEKPKRFSRAEPARGHEGEESTTPPPPPPVHYPPLHPRPPTASS